MRIAKFIAHSGYCSRREAEKLIYENKVKIIVIDSLCDGLEQTAGPSDYPHSSTVELSRKSNLDL